MTSDNSALYEHFLAWAQNIENIRAVIMLGSRASNSPVDKYSDYDLALFCKYPEKLSESNEWIHDLGEVWTLIHEEIELYNEKFPTRLIFFEGAQKIDFSILNLPTLSKLATLKHLPPDYAWGNKVVLDKDNLLSKSPKNDQQPPKAPKPTQSQFNQLIEEVYFEAMHIAQYLNRGDVWSAKFRDHDIKNRLLLTLLRWYHLSQTNWETDPHPFGKRLKSWLGEEAYAMLPACYSDFSAESSKKSLINLMKLIQFLASKVAAYLKFDYPLPKETAMMGYIERT